MTNGFYNTDSINTPKKRIAFFKEVVMLSHRTIIETKYSNDNVQWGRREASDKYTPLDIISAKKADVKVIDRIMYNGGRQLGDSQGEIAVVDEDAHEGWRFFYCFLTIENLNKIVKQFDLKLENWR